MKMNRTGAWFLLLFLMLFCSGCGQTQSTNSQPVKEKQVQHISAAKSESKADSKTVNKTDSNHKSTASLPKGKLKVYFFDVGQGDSMLIQTPKGENVLIDGGNNDKGDDVVRYLRQLHVSQLDDVIATHPDADHIGGLDTVLENLKVKNVYAPRVVNTTRTYEDFLLAVKNSRLKIKQAKANVDLGLRGASMKFVGPVKDYHEEMNDWSAVVKLSYGEKGTFLFTGDAPIRSEEDMIATHQDLSSQVLKVGHHGSKTATSQAFLDAVKPKYAIISVAKVNSYGLPSDEVINRLKANHIQIFRTDEMKTILAVTDGHSIEFQPVPSLTPNHLSSEAGNATASGKAVPPAKQPSQRTTSNGTLQAKVDDQTPQQYGKINLMVTGLTGAAYQATFHYKSKDTVYQGTAGTPLPVRISRAAPGYEVRIDIKAVVKGKTYSTHTSFTPQ